MSSKRAVHRFNKRKQCGTKRRYESLGIAVSHAIAATKEWGTPMWAYHCGWCEMWHIGNKRRGGRALTSLSRLGLISEARLS